MNEKPELIALEFLLGGSETSLENVLLNRLADVRNRRKEIIELLDSWAERQAEAMVLEWFLKHGAELVGSVTRTVTVTELQRLSDPAETSEDFRESLRKLVKSA